MTLNHQRYRADLPVVAFDSETELFSYANMAPRSVCYSFAWNDSDALLNYEEGADEVEALLRRALAGEIVIAGQNIAYDFAVLLRQRPKLWPLVIDAYEAGVIHDTMCAEWLIDTSLGLLRMKEDEETGEWKANKSYSLESLAIGYLRWPPYKDEWRMRYGELRDIPIDQWPEAAVIYPKRDAVATLRIAIAQRERAARVTPHDPLVADLAAKCRTYFALHLVSAWGMELDIEAVRAYKSRLVAACEALSPTLVEAGILYRHVRGKKAGQLSRRDEPLRQRVLADLIARGIDVSDEKAMKDRLTDGGKIKANAAALADCLDPVLVTTSDYLECSKQNTSFADRALIIGRGPVHPRYGFADTGRTTCSGGKKRAGAILAFNVQQMPRKVPEVLEGTLGMRECFVPRAGTVYSSTDYAILEMRTWAQCLAWMFPGRENPLRDALNAGADPHTMIAANILGIRYEDAVARFKAGDKVVKDWRQNSKPANYGFPGGMGANKFTVYAKSQGVSVDIETARLLRRNFDLWRPQAYFDYVSELTQYGSATIVQLGHSRRIRGDVGYTDACNGFFQGLAADLATDALWRAVIECYDERKRSPLFGHRIVAFLHDELFGEHPEEQAHEGATRIGEIMREAEEDHCPDLRPEAEPALMRRWSKAAGEPVRKNGRLVPYEDKEAA